MQGSNEHWFLPNAPVLAYNGALRNVLDNLLEVMQQRKSLEEMESTETVVVLESVLDAVINDSCDYVSVSHVHCRPSYRLLEFGCQSCTKQANYHVTLLLMFTVFFLYR